MKINPFIALFIILFISISSFTMGALIPREETPAVFSGLQEDLNAEKAKKLALMTGYFKAMERLKETPTVDLSQGTSQEWSQAYVDLANEMEVTLNGNENINAISAKIRTKLGQQSNLCTDPHGTAIKPKGTNVVNP